MNASTTASTARAPAAPVAPRALTARRIVVFVAALAAAGLAARLALWQLARADEKIALQSALEHRRALPPLAAAELPRDAAAVHALEYRAVLLTGRWRGDDTVWLDNRTMNGRAGFFALTPLVLADGGAVLVQRGWWPRDAAERTRIAAPPPPAGDVQVFGRIAAEPSRMFALGHEAAAPGPIRQNLDVAAFARETRLPLAPLVVVQADAPGAAAPAPDGLLRRWPLPAADVHTHYGYAFQWFALSALVLGLYVWFQLLRPHFVARAARSARAADAHRP